MIEATSLSLFLAVLPVMAPLAQESDTPAYLTVRDVAHGSVQTLSYRSKSLDREREAVVYLPPGYEQGSASYPVLYLLHGAGGNQRTWIDDGQANVILDNLIADQRVDPFIVVMPYGYSRPRESLGNRGAGAGQAANRGAGAGQGANRGAAPVDGRGAGRGGRGRGGFSPADYKTDMEEFAVDFIQDLIPLVESRYRVVADPDHRAVAGLSMGGGQAFAIGLTHPEMFSGIAGFSSAMQIANDPAWGGVDMQAMLANADAINEQIDLLWVGCGTEDTLFSANRAFSEQLTSFAVEHTFRVTLGGHTMAVWRRYLHELAPQLFAMQ
jgi:enterochelin esterase family protein